MSTTWFVNAGGKSSRFGSPKALALLDGETLLARAINSLQQVAREGDSVAVGFSIEDQFSHLADAEVTIILDDPMCEGPVSGLASALKFATSRNSSCLVVVPVDMPRINAAALVALRNKATNEGGTMISRGAISKDVLWTFNAIPSDLFGLLEAEIHRLCEASIREVGKSPSLNRILRTAKCDYLDLDDNMLLNVNYPNDLG